VVRRSTAGSSGVVVAGALWSGEVWQKVVGQWLQMRCGQEKYGRK
jgi:hypothetical protein